MFQSSYLTLCQETKKSNCFFQLILGVCLCFSFAAPSPALRSVHEELSCEEEHSSSQTGTGVWRDLEGGYRPAAQCEMMRDETETFLLANINFFYFTSDPTCRLLFPGVLQLPRRDVVPQGDDAVLTLRNRLLQPPSANQILSHVSSGRAVK